MKPKHLHVVREDEPRTFGSNKFLRLTRNPGLRSPQRFEPTVKGEGDIVL
jgi:hypothetical protein